MADLATLKQQLDALKETRASGALELQFGEERVRYKYDRDIERAIGALELEIAALEGNAKPRNLTVISSKGY